MSDEFIAELRQVLEEEVLVHIRAISSKLDSLHESIERHNKAMEAQFAAFLAEHAAYRLQQRAETEESRDSEADGNPSPKRLIQ